MNKQTLTPTEIESWQPVSEDGETYPAEPETRRRAARRSIIDALAVAGAGMAGAYWVDPSNVSGKSDQQEGWPDTVI